MQTRHLAWILAALTLGVAAVLLYGLQQGALLLPGKGFHLSVQRAANPIGFWLLAAAYAALAAACGWLWLMVRRASSAVADKAIAGTRMRIDGKVEISEDGRSGQIRVQLEGGSHLFYWEFGGGDCIAFIDAPKPAQWLRMPLLAGYPRDAFLQWLAHTVAQRKCPQAKIEISDRGIAFMQ